MKILVSEKAIEVKGIEYFEELKQMPNSQIVNEFLGECKDGLYGIREDMNTLRICLGRYCDTSKSIELA